MFNNALYKIIAVCFKHEHETGCIDSPEYVNRENWGEVAPDALLVSLDLESRLWM